MPRMALKAKEFRFAIDLDEGGSVRTEDGTRLEADPAWTAEHLLLAALVRCSLHSLRYSARWARVDVSDARGSARALFTKRDSDDRYAAVEVDVELAVRLYAEAGRGRARRAPRPRRARLLHRRVADREADVQLDGQLAGLERRERQPVPAELLPVELGLLLAARPDDRLPVAWIVFASVMPWS